MSRILHPFAATLLSVVVGTLFVVMSVAFVSIPFSTGGHPGENVVAATQIHLS